MAVAGLWQGCDRAVAGPWQGCGRAVAGPWQGRDRTQGMYVRRRREMTEVNTPILRHLFVTHTKFQYIYADLKHDCL